MKKFNIWTTAFLILFIILFAVFNIPYPIHKTVDALEINMEDSTHYIPRTIEIEGKVLLNLFSKPQFEGHITVSGYETYTEGWEMSPIDFSRDGYPLTYTKPLSSGSKEYEFMHFGRLYSEFLFKDAMIAFPISEEPKQQTTANCNVIVTNTSTRSEAYAIACLYFGTAE